MAITCSDVGKKKELADAFTGGKEESLKFDLDILIFPRSH